MSRQITRRATKSAWRQVPLRSAALLLCVAAVGVGTTARSASAHPLDQLVQMAFISIAADSIGVELDLTPGLKVAGAYYDTLDSDRNGRISEAERVRYRELVARALALSADGAAVPLVITDVRWPTEEQLRDGEGMVRLFAVARLAAPRAGAHVLTFRNDHEPVSSGYMVNPLAPQPPIALVHVTRDYLQHGISVYYTIAPVQPQGNTNGASAIAGFIGAGLTALAAAGVAWRRRVRL